ncbi:unnamed protein product, partial [marine sediment metagenome]
GRYKDLLVSGNDVKSLLRAGDAVGATGAVMKLAKVYDQMSAARQSEVDAIGASTGAEEWARNQLASIQGQGFGPESIAMFDQVVDALLGNAALINLAMMGGYEEDLINSGLTDDDQKALFRQVGIDKPQLERMIGSAIPFMNDDQKTFIKEQGF